MLSVPPGSGHGHVGLSSSFEGGRCDPVDRCGVTLQCVLMLFRVCRGATLMPGAAREGIPGLEAEGKFTRGEGSVGRRTEGERAWICGAGLLGPAWTE